MCILVGIVVAVWLTQRRWAARGGRAEDVLDIAAWTVPFGIVGGRLYHVISSPELYFAADRQPVRAFCIWEGGLGIWGAVALGAVGAWIGCRRKGVRLSTFADAVAPGLVLAQAIGRWGNWFNQELFGSPSTRFRTALLIDDLTFDRDAPAPGDHLPAFDLPTLDGGRFAAAAADLGPRPVLLIFGSRTCPVTESAGPILNPLHSEFGDRVRFVLVNTREAHPGQRFGQPRTADEKRQHAEELRRHHQIRFDVVVDDLDGRLHRTMSPKPNSAYLIDPAGVIRFRAHWANDEDNLRTALADITAGRIPHRDRSRAMAVPLLRAVGHLPDVVRFAGGQAERDIWLAATPLAVLGRLSRLFGRLPKDRRGAAAAALSAAAVILAAGVIIGVAR